MKKRKFTKYGNTDVIRLKPQDKEDMELKYGEDVNIEDIKIKKKVKIK